MTHSAESWLVRHRHGLLLGVSTFLYVTFLGVRDFWYPDEPDIGEVAKAMFVSGDWIAPRRNGVIWVDYPPLLYWAGCVCSHVLGGVSEFSLRLASALGAIALVLLTAAVGSRWFGARAGLWAGFMLLTFSQFLYGAISYRPDMLFTLPIAAAFFAYLAGTGERESWGLRIVAFALLGAAMLAKGPLGLLLPGLVLTLFHAARREWKLLLQLAPLSLAAVAVAAPWAFACAEAMGSETFWGEIYAQNFGRYESGSRGHGKPLHYYAVVLWADLGPWFLMFPFALRWWIRTGRWRDRNGQLLLWWAGVLFVFLSAAATKRQVYMMPAHPAFALLLAPWFAGLFRQNGEQEGEAEAPSARAGFGFLTVCWVFLVACGAVALAASASMDLVLPRFEMEPGPESAVRALRLPLAGFGALCLALGLWIRGARRAGDGPGGLFRVGASLIPIYVALMWWVVPTSNAHKTYAPQCAWIVEQIPEDETHIGLYFPERNIAKMGAFGFYTGRLVTLVWNTWDLEQFFLAHPRSLALVSDAVSDELFADDPRWRERVVHELDAGRYHYFVVRGSRDG